MTKRKQKLTAAPVKCSVAWCIAICAPEATLCAVHRISADVRPEPLAEGESFIFTPFIGNVAQSPAKVTHCHYCNDTGDCEDCDGHGEHSCGRGNCTDLHECGNCDGTGECPECDGKVGEEIYTPHAEWEKPKPQRLLADSWQTDRALALNYLRAVYPPVFLPPQATAQEP